MECGRSYGTSRLLVLRQLRPDRVNWDYPAARGIIAPKRLAFGWHRNETLRRNHILRPVDNMAPDDALSPRYTAEKSGLW